VVISAYVGWGGDGGGSVLLVVRKDPRAVLVLLEEGVKFGSTGMNYPPN